MNVSKAFRELWVSFTVLLAMGALSACGSQGTKVAEGIQPFRLDPMTSGISRSETLNLIRGAARSGRLQCPFKDECDPALVMLSVVAEEGLERCSGVLVSDDEVLTNDHCINKSVSLKGWESRYEKLPCKGFVFLHFAPVSGGNSLDVECDEIESRSGESGVESRDFALIRLSQKVQDRLPVRTALRGFIDQEQVTVHRVQMSNGADVYDGAQDFLNCKTSYSTFLYPALNTIKSPLMTFGDCAIQAGNSGSPIYNQNGEMGAIVQGYLTVKQDALVQEDLRRTALDGSYGEVGVGTQTECMERLNPFQAHLCTPVLPMAGMSVTSFLTTHDGSQVPALPELPVRWEWSQKSSGDLLRQVFFSKPICSDELQFDSTEIDFKKGLNRFLEAEWRKVEASAGSKGVLTFSGSGTTGSLPRTFTNSELGLVSIAPCGEGRTIRLGSGVQSAAKWATFSITAPGPAKLPTIKNDLK